MADKQTAFQELVLRAKAGDKDAFSEIYETHLTPVYRYCYIRLGNREEAEDIVQETFLKAYLALQRFEATRDNFLPYLFTVARNLLINKGKKKHPDLEPGEVMDREDGGMNTSSYAEEKELSQILREAMEILTDDEREIVAQRYFGERTYAEIAATFDKREDAVRQHIARAMKKMRKHLIQYD